MKVLTEVDLRNELRRMGPVERLVVPPGTILTPAARSFLSERRIELVYGEEEKGPGPCREAEEPGAEGKGRFEILGAGVRVDEKPEAFTHLKGNKLVPKTHPRIRLRGKMDSLEAKILLAQVALARMGLGEAVSHLEEVLAAVRRALRAEVLDEPLEEFELFGLSWSEVREMSHHPRKFVGVDHFVPSWEMGEAMAHLNLIRTQIRECEIAACEAFHSEAEGTSREDLVRLFNRLSSALYLMMCWLKAGRYRKGGA